MAFACARAALGQMAGRCIGFTSFPKAPIWLACQKMGLGTLYPPRVQREQTEVHDPQFQTRCRFGHSSPVTRKTRVSCSMVTTVLTSVHMCFPYPLPRHPLAVLLSRFVVFTHDFCACGAGCLIAASHEPITRDARAVGVTSFQKWFRWLETRHLERCRSVCDFMRGARMLQTLAN